MKKVLTILMVSGFFLLLNTESFSQSNPQKSKKEISKKRQSKTPSEKSAVSKKEVSPQAKTQQAERNLSKQEVSEIRKEKARASEKANPNSRIEAARDENTSVNPAGQQSPNDKKVTAKSKTNQGKSKKNSSKQVRERK